MTRQPAVSGQFYPADPEELRMQLRRMLPPSSGKRKVIGIVAPHAGYLYSGSVAGKVYGSIEIPRVALVLAPNHTGLGSPVALYPEGEWLTPLGPVPVERDLSSLVRSRVPPAVDDTLAHRYEHSLEVQLPFLRFLRPDISIVPLCLGFADHETCTVVGEGIAAAVREFGEEVLLVASSDMTHYESSDAARRKDEQALAEIRMLNPHGLLRICREKGITMCGVVPAAVMLTAALTLGATHAEVAAYTTSGEVTGDYRQVVAYAAVEVW